jgi:hypothetical protein
MSDKRYINLRVTPEKWENEYFGDFEAPIALYPAPSRPSPTPTKTPTPTPTISGTPPITPTITPTPSYNCSSCEQVTVTNDGPGTLTYGYYACGPAANYVIGEIVNVGQSENVCVCFPYPSPTSVDIISGNGTITNTFIACVPQPTPTPTPSVTPSAVVTYDLLAENGDTLQTETGDNLRREQNI